MTFCSVHFSQNLQGQKTSMRTNVAQCFQPVAYVFWTPTTPSDLRGSSLVLLETSKWPGFGNASKTHKGSRCVSRPNHVLLINAINPYHNPPLCSKNSPLRSAEPKCLTHLQHAISNQIAKSTEFLLSHYIHLKKKSPAHLIDFLCRKVMHFIAPARDQGPWDLKWQKKNNFSNTLLLRLA